MVYLVIKELEPSDQEATMPELGATLWACVGLRVCWWVGHGCWMGVIGETVKDQFYRLEWCEEDWAE